MSPEPTVKVVVEAATDAQLLRAILGGERAKRLRFFAARGRASLATVGRNILVHEGGPVLLVMDTDTRDKHLADEVRSMVSVAMGGVVPPGLPQHERWYRVFAFVPEIEVVFFEAPEALDKLLGVGLPEPTVNRGLLAPKDTLTNLLAEAGGTYSMLLERIDPEAAAALASGGQARALTEAVESLVQPRVAV